MSSEQRGLVSVWFTSVCLACMLGDFFLVGYWWLSGMGIVRLFVVTSIVFCCVCKFILGLFRKFVPSKKGVLKPQRLSHMTIKLTGMFSPCKVKSKIIVPIW